MELPEPQAPSLHSMTDTPSNDTTPAERRALLLELLLQDLPLGAFLDLAAGHLPLVPLCTPNQNQRGCMQHGTSCEKPGKTPLVGWKAYQDGPPASAQQVQQWRQRWPAANWALATGGASGILLLDQDGHDAARLDPPSTVRVRTGRPGGYHHYFAYPDGVPIKNAVAFAPGWDVRSQGGLLILPGSLHPSGARYQVDVVSLVHGFAAVPPALLAQLQAPAGASALARPHLDMVTVFAGVPEGQRDDTLWRLVFKLRQADVPAAVTEAVVLQAAAACQPPFAAVVVREKVERAYSMPPAAEGPPSTGGCEAALEQARAENAALKERARTLEAENAELRRRETETERLISNLLDWQRDPSTREVVYPVLVLWQKRQALVAAGKPPDTPIPWPLAELAQELGFHRNKAGQLTKQLVEHGVVEQSYKQLGHPEDGDYRREQRLTLVLDLPDDLPDALNRIRRCVREERPPRKVAQPRSACDACRSARCPEHPDAPIQKHVAVRCTVCDASAAPDHTHAPQRPSLAPPPVVQFIRTRDARPPVRDAESKHENRAPTYVVEDMHENRALTPPSGDVLDQATAAAETIATTLGAHTLPPAEAIPLQLAILRECARCLRAGQAPPTPTETCDTCGAPLGRAEFLRCDGCAHQEVA